MSEEPVGCPYIRHWFDFIDTGQQSEKKHDSGSAEKRDDLRLICVLFTISQA